MVKEIKRKQKDESQESLNSTMASKKSAEAEKLLLQQEFKNTAENVAIWDLLFWR
jgi:hypothetical protein